MDLNRTFFDSISVSNLLLERLRIEYLEYYQKQEQDKKYKHQFITELKEKMLIPSSEECNSNIKDIVTADHKDQEDQRDQEDQTDLKNPKNSKDPEHPDMKLAKKYYKVISRKTHPDKIKNTKLVSYFEQAYTAYQQADLALLALISYQLNIEINDDLSQTIQQRISELQKQTIQIKSSIPYQYYQGDPNNKEKLVQNFLKTNGFS